jgi:hypothetical protein
MLSNSRFRRDRPTSLLGKRSTASLGVACALVVGARLANPAVAWGESVASSLPKVSAAPLKAVITRSQTDAFADLLGEPVEDVAWRLRYEPSLIPLAAAAADARLARQNSGKQMMTGGFILFGFGMTLSLGALMSTMPALGTCDDPCQASPMSAKAKAIDVVGLVTAALGLALAIPGIVVMARQTDIETEAVNSYQLTESDAPPKYSPVSSHSLPVGSGGKALSFSLWSFTF